MHHPRLPLPFLLIAPLLLGALTIAQPPTTPAKPPRPQPADIKPAPIANPGAIELAQEPFRLDNVGLVMFLPAGSTVEASQAGGKTTAHILPPEPRTWLMNIQTPRTETPATTIKDTADQIISLVQGSVGVVDPNQKKVLQTDAQILERTDTLQLKAGPCERFYISMPGNPTVGGGAGNAEKTRVIKGYTIFKPAPAQFVIFELVTPEPEFNRNRKVFETSVATAEFVAPGAVAAARGAAVKSGVHLMESLTSKDYEAVLDGKERWYRLYRPAKGGAPADAEEIGYRGVTFWRGKRGELDPTRPTPRGQGNRADLQDGYLVRFRIRLVERGAGPGVGGGTFIDTTATYFMTPDREEEAWNIQAARRDSRGTGLRNWSEIGARSKNDLTVMISDSQPQPPTPPIKTTRPLLQGEGYISQVESFILPQLLIRSAVAAEFGFYVYRSAAETVTFRRDTLGRDPASAGAWTLKTEYRDDASPQLSIYSNTGELIRSELEGGRVWKPIEPKELFDLWKQKGLPTGQLK